MTKYSYFRGDMKRKKKESPNIKKIKFFNIKAVTVKSVLTSTGQIWKFIQKN